MSWLLTEEHLEDLARGAAVLGTGGGGDPYVGRLLVRQAIRECGPVTVLDPAEVDDEALVIPTAQMGAPTVVFEKIPSGDEALTALRALERHLGTRAAATMPIECGGINSMIPLVVAARSGLPVVDADGMGRAFPELQMETFGVYGVTGSPMAVAGERGETSVIDTGADNKRMEWLARGITIRLGGVAHIAEYSMRGAEVKRTAVPRTLTLAHTVGRALREARERQDDPIAHLGEVLAGSLYQHLRVLFRGKISDVERRTEAGFARGRATAKSFDGRHELDLVFQNEHLVALVDGEVRCLVPDLVCVLESEQAEPITTESLRYGQRVTVVGISTPELMRTPQALAVFGPAAFGLRHEFRPVEALTTAES
ncbi:hypothetical protein A8924_4914 [Saccharopolyspora erythraea NRRL 2338]|uniref:Uncharacterized protein n=2 Tax=Saccharopolyspora erythraea TaxID=1836 RepID=A4FIC2_SACEN|nr:DUF917 domain-containing protein [Saccharopolyspora erythraea]EQD82100.1 hypothetical protein N599_32525 [Saccharopolyspora erythraea D]PFG97474.1 hypothetical protein A8924_4914 [Saccharopolyspora erythraea NRRL 2338]QRK87652.1 DUF917 domain-containing protein [Saccharopolyspora erythraea]CAM03797.1 hypothetical protein SACE_4528 [Saccharopolyspora erythraea NRRL 2338]